MSKNRNDKQKSYERTYDEKRAGQRTRNWTVIFYPEDLPEDWTSLVDDLRFRWVESPIHSEDLSADGTPKKPHCHTLFMFENVKTFDQVSDMLKNIFGESENGSIIGVAAPQQVSDRCALVRYMVHMDHPEKVQYDVSEIIGHNGVDVTEILKYSVTETRLMIVAMEEYIEDNNVTELSDFSRAIRYDYPEWHTILATKMTVYFNAFIRSCRHKLNQNQPTKIVMVNGDGEIINNNNK